MIRGTNQLLIDEVERSVHDALCIVRCIVKNKGVLGGGGAIEIELSRKLEEYALSLDKGTVSMAIKGFAEALEIIPFTLAENCGLKPLNVVTELRNKHR